MPNNSPGFKILPLEQFSDWIKDTRISRVIDTIQVHHSIVPNYGHFDSKNHMKLMMLMDMQDRQRGASGIGQQITIFPDGKIGLGREFDENPNGISKDNSTDVCIKCIGNFDMDSDNMTAEQKNSIITTLALLCKKFNIEPSTDTIVYPFWFHLATGKRDNGGPGTSHKSSPGNNFFGGNKVEEADAILIPYVKKKLSKLDFPVEQIAKHDTTAKAVVTADSIRVRNSAHPTAETIDFLQRATKVSIYEEKDGWYLIDTVEPRWISTRFVQVLDEI